MSGFNFDDQRDTVNTEYDLKSRIAKRKGNSLVYPNQEAASKRCLELFVAGTLFVLLVAQPGTGKTGTILETLKILATDEDNEKCVKTNDIFIMSGMDDTDWRDQMKDKMLPSFHKNIYHRSALPKQADKLSLINNGIVVTDECHYASGKDMTVSNTLRAAGLSDYNALKARKIRLLDISATCEGLGWDIKAWGDKAAVVPVMPGPTYKGFQVMIDEGRIIQAPDFDDYAVVQDWVGNFQERYKNTTKKYFPIRINSKKHTWFGNIRNAAHEFGWVTIEHNSDSRIEKIDEMMTTAPEKHTIIFIKGFWRASKRLERKHVGGSYEDVPKTKNVTSASQGLIGRFCDNYEYEGDELNPDLRPIHYGDLQAIEDYVAWFNGGCDFRSNDYSCARIKSKSGHISSKATKIHSSNISNLDATEVHNDPRSAITLINKNREDWWKTFEVANGNDEEQWNHAKSFYKSIIGKELKGKAMRKKVEDFYLSSTTKRKGKLSKADVEECFEHSWWSTLEFTANKLNFARVFVGYDNLNDPTKYTIYIKNVKVEDTEENLAIINGHLEKRNKTKKPKTKTKNSIKFIIEEESDDESDDGSSVSTENEVIGLIDI